MAQSSLGILLQTASSGSLKQAAQVPLKQKSTAQVPEFGQYLNADQKTSRADQSLGRASKDVRVADTSRDVGSNAGRDATPNKAGAVSERSPSTETAQNAGRQPTENTKTQGAESVSSSETSVGNAKRNESTAEVDSTVQGGKPMPEEGQALPLDDRTREILAQLDDDQLKKVLSKLAEWINQHPDADLNQLNLPDELQAQLDQLASELGLNVADLDAAVRDMAVSLQQLPEGQHYRLAWNEYSSEQSAKRFELVAIRSSQSSSVAHEAPVKSQEALVSEVVDKWRQQQDSSRRELLSGQKSLEQQASSRQQQDMLASESLFNRYVTSQKEQKIALSMNAVAGSALDSKGSARGDALQQLMQTAGQGLQQLQSSAVNASRANMPTLPLMTAQAGAAAQSNASALVERIAVMQSRNMKIADIRLDPPELGALRIRIHMQGDQANISFQSPHAHVRDALEQSMPRLRDMLAEQGMDMGEANVADQQNGERSIAQDMAASHDGGAGEGSGSAQESGVERDTDGITISVPQRQLLGLVDAYA